MQLRFKLALSAPLVIKIRFDNAVPSNLFISQLIQYSVISKLLGINTIRNSVELLLEAIQNPYRIFHIISIRKKLN